MIRLSGNPLPRIGFIGLGMMGKPMALNLLHAGYPMTVMSRSRAPIEELVAAGATEAGGAVELARQSDVVITMLPGPDEVRQVLLGSEASGGVILGVEAGMLIIDMSTIAPAVSRELAQVFANVEVGCIDAPVSGGEAGARNKQLAIMVGGDDIVVERARPVLEVLGHKVTHVGGPGTGQVVKLANQVIVAGTIALVAEAIGLCVNGGVEGEAFVAALEGGFADSAILRNHGIRMLKEQFQPGFRLSLQLKDLQLARDLARQENIRLEVLELVHALVDRAVGEGLGRLDHAALAMNLALKSPEEL